MTDHFPDDALTQDAFLNGRVMALQPRDGYRAATDPVFLAASVPARTGQNVLELGCGAGVASLCLGARIGGLTVAGVEVQPAYADLARRNAAANSVDMTVFDADLTALPAPLRDQRFDHVIANPPYYAAHGPSSLDAGRDRALREETPLGAWVDVALRRACDGGYVTFIHLSERLPDLLAGFVSRASLTVLPLTARAARPARRVIVQARKGGRAPFVLLPPLVIHQGDTHPGDCDHFSGHARAILRDAAALDMAAVMRA